MSEQSITIRYNTIRRYLTSAKKADSGLVYRTKSK